MEGAKNNVVIPSVNTVSPSEGGDVPTKVEYSTTVDENEANDNKWYTIDGLLLQQKPTQKGVYIFGGKKVVIK